MDITCKCGHPKRIHIVPKKLQSKVIQYLPSACYLKGAIRQNKFEWACKCIKYTPDNLMHIERLAKQKELI